VGGGVTGVTLAYFLAKEGAKYDIVNCIGVDDVEKIGLEAALYKSLSE